MKRWLDSAWTQEMRLEIDVNLMMAPVLGEKEGISEEDLEKLFPTIQAVQEQLEIEKNQNSLPFLTLPFDLSVLPTIKKFVQEAKTWAENFVVLGIGGSSLGAKALHGALLHPFHNLLSKNMRKGFPRLFVIDNVDPDGFKSLLDLLEVRKTLFNVISKSGGTAETMSQFLIIRDLLKKKLGNRKEKDHLVITTDPVQGVLRRIAEEEQFKRFEIPSLLGGRFSVLSAVGLLPAAMGGVDVEELQAGAREMARRCQVRSLWGNPACLCACLSFLSYKQKKKNIRVIMPYADALKGMGEWFCQLWAESLGKRVNTKGREVWNGQTPVTALGATDQHSQLQLYVEGPGDKVFSFLGVKHYSSLMPLPKLYPKMEGLAYLGGRSLNKLIQAEMQATRLSLARNGRPSLILTLPKINPFTIGQLIFLWELETYICGQLMGINPLNQPGVEEGKNLTYAFLGRKGFENQIKEGESTIKAYDKKYLL
ncbi:MAG: glucose-6-phosphate isomerase [Thermodesulfobacteriota bacterium]